MVVVIDHVAAALAAERTITMSSMQSKRHPQRDVESPSEPPEGVVGRLAELLPEGALDEAVRGLRPEELSGPGGLLSRLAGRVVEAALEAEMTEHLGHPPGGRPQGSDVRNGATAKTVQSDLGPVEVKTPRDRQHRPRSLSCERGCARACVHMSHASRAAPDCFCRRSRVGPTCSL